MAGWWLALIPIECGRRSAPEQERSFFVHTLDHNQSRWKKRQRYTPAFLTQHSLKQVRSCFDCRHSQDFWLMEYCVVTRGRQGISGLMVIALDLGGGGRPNTLVFVDSTGNGW